MFNQSKAFAIGLLIAVFLAGVALGATGLRWLGPSPRPNRSYADRLAQNLQLSTAQRDSVVAILRRYDPQMRAIFLSVQPQMDSLRERLRGDIRAQLTAAQLPAYQKIIERDRARFARRDSASQRSTRHDDD